MKKKLLSLILAVALALAIVIPVSAADNAYIFDYNGMQYSITQCQENDISSAKINEIVAAMKSGNLKDENETSMPMIMNPILIYNNTYIPADPLLDKTLSSCGIRPGDTINVYDFGNSFCLVYFESNVYPLNLSNGNTVLEVKTAISSGNVAGRPTSAPAVDDILLYDSTGNLLTDGQTIMSESKIYLYNKNGGTVTDTIDPFNNQKHPVTATYQMGAAAPTTYSVSITWGSMEFTYTEPQKVWNPETHTEENGEGSGTFTCADGANQITVVNHSNANVTARFSFTGNNSVFTAGVNTGFTGTATNNTESALTDNAVILDSAVGKEATASATVVVSLNLDGKLSSDPGANPIGTVTVTIDSN